MSYIAPIATAIKSSAGNAATQIVRANHAQVVTGQAASLAATGGFSLLAYLGQALKAPLAVFKAAPEAAPGVVAPVLGAAKPAGEALAIGTGTMTKEVFSSSILGHIGLGTVMVGDLVTAGAAGMAAYFANGFVKATTGTGVFSIASKGVGSVYRGITGLFSRAPKAAQGLKTVA
jgi:hypothetical protein